jgi:hypothetical protein
MGDPVMGRKGTVLPDILPYPVRDDRNQVIDVFFEKNTTLAQDPLII